MTIKENKQLHHLGLVAGMCDEIGLDKIIDHKIGSTKRDVSVGKAVKAMILNALGFTGRALYLTPVESRSICTKKRVFSLFILTVSIF
jgi:transposase